jgi:hypothetical protein
MKTEHRILVRNHERKRLLGDRYEAQKVVSKWILRKWDVGDVDWINLAPDRFQWWALVHIVIEILGSIKRLDVF